MNSNLLFDRSYVNGQWVSESNTYFQVTNPANGETIATVADGGVSITEKAIDAADKAFKPWSKTTAKHRASILEKWNDLILAHTNDLAEIMTLECGKPLAESRGEVAYGSSFL